MWTKFHIKTWKFTFNENFIATMERRNERLYCSVIASRILQHRDLLNNAPTALTNDLSVINPFTRGREVKSAAEKGLKRIRAGKRNGAPAGAGVIVDIQRGKYTISRPHKFSQSDEPPCAVRGGLFPPRAWRQRYLCASSRARRSVDITRAQHARICTPTRNSVVRIVYPRMSNSFRLFQNSLSCRKIIAR